MAYTDIDKPSDYFNTLLWTGADTNSGRDFTGVGFQPDLVWTKTRSDSNGHKWFDSVRGVGKSIQSESLGAETTNDGNGYIDSFDADGFSSVAGSTNNYNFNNTSTTFASWNWKAGTAVSGTTSGSGTGKAYSGSVNTDAGFSIIKYLGNGSAGHTIPHHLGAVVKMIILKRNANTNWSTYHVGMGNGKSLPLNEGEAPTTSTSFWNDTTPTSSVFTVGSISNTNSNDSSIIAYCFADVKGYSKFGSYTGNGSTDGTFVYTGFKPAWVMVKLISGSDNWTMADNKRNGFNADNDVLYPNLANAEVNTNWVDLLSNGFKMRRSDGAENGSGSTYIYMAFAENPFVTSTGIPTTAR